MRPPLLGHARQDRARRQLERVDWPVSPPGLLQTPLKRPLVSRVVTVRSVHNRILLPAVDGLSPSGLPEKLKVRIDSAV
jgi:hypothetical protein